jgi:hypothetical protein
MDPNTATEVAFKNGFDAGLNKALTELTARLTAKPGLGVKGVPHYITTDHELKVLTDLIRKEFSYDPNP